jgi:hypothetical protein
MERTNSDSSKTCILRRARYKYKFPCNSKQLSLGYIWNIIRPRNVQTYTEGNKPICNTANKQKEARGPSENQICNCMVEYMLITWNNKFHFDNHTHEHVMYVISTGLRSVIIHTQNAASVGMSRDRFLTLLCSNQITVMKRQLGDSRAMSHNSKFRQLSTHHKISGRIHIGKIPISRTYILSSFYQRKAKQYGIKCLNFVRHKATTSTT